MRSRVTREVGEMMLRAHLRAYVHMAQHGTRPEQRPPAGWAYLCVEELLLQHGQTYAPTPLPPRVRPMASKQCYFNAAALARRSPSLTYVEGVALGVIPVSHAWCVTEDGVVVDPTWTDLNGGVGGAYLGLPFPSAYVRQQQTLTNGSVLHDFENNYPLLRVPWSQSQERFAALAAVNP